LVDLIRKVRGFASWTWNPRVAETRAVVAAANGSLVEGGQLDQRLKWAEAYADRIDPHRSLREELEGTGESDASAAGNGSMCRP